MTAAPVRKTPPIWWMLVLSTIITSCSAPGLHSPSRLISTDTTSPLSQRTTEELLEEHAKRLDEQVKKLQEDPKSIFLKEHDSIAEAVTYATQTQRLYAEMRRRAKQGDARAQRFFAELPFDADAIEGFLAPDSRIHTETWRCFKLFDRKNAKPLLTLTRVGVGNKDLFGEVSVAGVAHWTQFRITGLNRRWDWGCDKKTGCPYAFVIRPDNHGAYYDFSVSDDGRAKPRQIFECQLSS